MAEVYYSRFHALSRIIDSLQEPFGRRFDGRVRPRRRIDAPERPVASMSTIRRR